MLCGGGIGQFAHIFFSGGNTYTCSFGVENAYMLNDLIHVC